MLPLSDSELDTIISLATPIEQSRRDEFLRALADRLLVYPERGDGLVFRVGRDLQREFVTVARGPVRRYR